MNIIYEYSHLGGSEILQVRYPQINKDIYDVISKVKALRLKKSREKSMIGKMLYSPKDLNNQFRKQFHSLSYKEIRDYCIILGKSTTNSGANRPPIPEDVVH